MNKINSLTIFFPCYNDAGTIASMVLLAEQTVKKITSNYEIIVVNDASADASLQVLQLLKKKLKKLRVLNHKKNKGYGGTLKSGFKTAKKEWLFYTDGDFQYDVQELLKLVKAVNKKTELIQAYKIKRQDPWYRILIGHLYNWFVKIIFSLPFKDIDCDFRLIKRKAIQKIKLDSDTGVICVEMMLKLKENKINYKEIPVCHYPRQYQASQFFNFKRILDTGLALIKLYWRFIKEKNG